MGWPSAFMRKASKVWFCMHRSDPGISLSLIHILIGVDDYEYFGEDTITAEGWLRFMYRGMEVMVNTNEVTPGGGWDFTGAERVKSNAPVSIVDAELLQANQNLADAVMFD